MSKEIERVTRLIRELLKKTEAHGCTEAEASAAAGKVQELLLKYNLSMKDVPREGSRNIKYHIFIPSSQWARLSWDYTWALAHQVATQCLCKVMRYRVHTDDSGYKTDHIIFIGSHDNTAVAEKLYTWLFENAYASESYHWRRRKGTPRDHLERYAHYAAFMKGYITVLCQRLVQNLKAAQTSTELVRVVQDELTEIDRYIAEQSGKVKNIRTKQTERNEATTAGIHAALQAKLNSEESLPNG